MDFQSEKRRQTLKVIFADSIMAIAVILLAWLFVMIVSGYRINADFEVERNGLLQVYSTPRGANVTVDDDQWLAKTNASQMISASQHKVVLTKEGYDSWSKDVEVLEGLLYKLSYPRLFKLEREQEEIVDVANWGFLGVSKTREALIFQDELEKYQVVDLLRGVVEMKTETEVKKMLAKEPLEPETAEKTTQNMVTVRFYNDDYKISLEEGQFVVLMNDLEEPLLAENVGAELGILNVSKNEDFVWASSGKKVLVLDMEAMKLNQFELNSEQFGWLDDYLLYEVVDGALVVYDFDGLNRRVVVDKNVSARFPAVITKNNYLYYFSDGILVREKID